jgi:hypothetical protein
MPAWPFVFYCLTGKIAPPGERPPLATNWTRWTLWKCAGIDNGLVCPGFSFSRVAGVYLNELTVLTVALTSAASAFRRRAQQTIAANSKILFSGRRGRSCLGSLTSGSLHLPSGGEAAGRTAHASLLPPNRLAALSNPLGETPGVVDR